MLVDTKLGTKGLIDATYPSLVLNYAIANYLQDKAILAPTNEQVNTINDEILELIPGKVKTYLSSNAKLTGDEKQKKKELFYTTEFLNSLKTSALPNHCLKLKVNVPIILLRNINQRVGLCNGTRLIITKLGQKVLKAEIIIGSNIGKVVTIPRIKMFSDKGELPFIMRRTQFPIKLAFAMTINKSQGQTLSKIGICLQTPVFSHGQLYVDVLRATSRQSLKFLLGEQTDMPLNYTQNIVYKDVLQEVMEQIVASNPINEETCSKYIYLTIYMIIAATAVDHFTLTTEQVTKHKERANKRKVEQEPKKISKRNVKKRLEYEPIARKQNNKSLHEKERQSLAKDKEIICNSIFEGMDSTVEEYNVNLQRDYMQ
ncbi:uncharacterized protein LOC109821213 [Asparagus officinalis]|uniref:uncharacterized protein LOC109821213 n=1 Tax=Asparagus officinalis TaxID=4686 RepID=UPI00098E048A|nr:uncharacterized protein LOC109821213 [Asparagus officinalis]